ncbi:acetyl-CoA synthetase [Actinomycetospora sp. NBRC 106375]|uniref:acetate--CoA ligase family protein n=1 Tax=Actinomycetospora sp. NBRC 106375 TaxID=3032207 RepID=UPI0024A2D46A|nr:acetate--CoA ligase [Actinomycetospora sp. NBRC 106375]GLZ48233.1 acetyl-CoA synthetase [Actinomycetospora sp. NBRC 106375]
MLLEALFSPRRVAVVGYSDRAGSLGHVLATNLADFPGEVVPVRGGESLRDVDGEIDLAVVSVPAPAVPDVAADAAAKGVAAMVVLSGGFAEVGPDGADLQARLVAQAGPVRVVGPNCFGIQNCDLPLNASMATGLPSGGGGISLVSQSGAYGMAIRTLAVDERTRFAKILAPGNTCDVTIAELLGELSADPATRTLCFLLESLADGRAFVATARRTGREKPVIVAKTGRSAAGARAAASHTAALASSENVWRGVFAQAGVVEVSSGQELLDVARALDGQPRPAGDRVAVITNSGGVGVELCDLLADEGLVVPALSAPLQETIRAMLPAFASPVNPVDVTPVWSRFAELYPAITDLLARSGEVDVVVPVLLQRAAMDAATAEGLRDAVAGLRADGVDVPVAVCWVAPRDARPNADLLQESGVPCFDWPARTARALGHAQRWARSRERPLPAVRAVEPAAAPPPLDPAAAATFLARFGVPTASSTTCATPDAAVAAATSFPAVVKIAEAAHRTELGGVRVGLGTAEEVRAAAVELLPHGPVLVQPLLAGVEVAVGALRDPVFGPVVMVGLGGIWIEVLADVAFALAPLDRADARALLGRLRGSALLTGARGAEPVDLDALADVVVGAGDALVAADDVTGIDLNPVLATPSAAVAVDWKVT